MVSPHPSLYFLIQFFLQLYMMSTSAPDEISIEDPLCNSSLGSMVTLDYVTPLTSVMKVSDVVTMFDERAVELIRQFWNSPMREYRVRPHVHFSKETTRSVKFRQKPNSRTSAREQAKQTKLRWVSNSSVEGGQLAEEGEFENYG